MLYTPQVLALATGLAHWPWDETMPLVGEARSASCGSRLRVGLALGPEEAITGIAISAQACAIGQAAASIMAQAIVGRTAQSMTQAERDISAWLAGDGLLPDWPGLADLAVVRSYPGRHGAFMLGWRAVLAALTKHEVDIQK